MDGKANGNGVPDTQDDGGAANYLPYDDGTTTILMVDGIDPAKVQFIDGHKKKDLNKADDGEFVGLRKEELAKYANDPYWVRLRIILLLVFAAAWVAMLVAAILIIVFAPRCPPRPAQEWWEKAVIYHIHPLSFQDSDADGKIGNGDLNGIHSRLQYLKNELNVDAVSLGPIYPSGFEADGFDVLDHTKPCGGHYGSVTDFDSLRAALHKEGIKLILDFIPNHTSRNHPWFLQSKNASSMYSDFYIWRDGRTSDDPPNDWTNVHDGKSAWTKCPERGQFYYHTFSKYEPDLNLRNEYVKIQMEGALKVWLERKVDGFRIRDAQYLIEPEDLRQDKESIDFQPESFALVTEWRSFMDNFTEIESKSRSRKTSRVLIADVNGVATDAIKFYGVSEGYVVKPGAHLVTNKALVALNASCDSLCVLGLIKSWTSVAINVSSNWQVGNADVSRVASRYSGTQYLNAVNLLMMTLGGSALPLYGDELGMMDGPTNQSTLKSNETRGQLTPMLWNNSRNAGFTAPNKTPWTPVVADGTSLQTQQAHGSTVNHFGVFKRLLSLRSTSEALQWGTLKGVEVQGGVLLYMREAEGFNRLLVAINFGPSASTVDFTEYERAQFEDNRRLPLEMTIVTSTFNFKGTGRADAYNNGTKIEPQKMIYLEPTEGVVLSWPPSADRYE